MTIQLKEDGSKGYAMASENEIQGGMMTYSIASPTLIIIDHTEVEPAFEGKGVGKKMLFKIVDMARERDIKVIPLCPFAASMFKKLDAIKDVLRQ